MEGERLTVLRSRPYFRACSKAGFYRYQRPPKGRHMSIVFGSCFDVDLQVGPRSLRRRHADLLQLMTNEYKHAILAALMAESKVQLLYLQPLVHPNDRQLFKLSLVALGNAMAEAAKLYDLIPIKLLLPLLPPRAFHADYGMEMIRTLEEHVPTRSTVVIERISFSAEKQLFATTSIKSSPLGKESELA